MLTGSPGKTGLTVCFVCIRFCFALLYGDFFQAELIVAKTYATSSHLFEF